MIKNLLLPLFCLFFCITNAQQTNSLSVKENFVLDKNYFFLHQLQIAPDAVKSSLTSNQILKNLLQQKLASIKLAIETSFQKGIENIELFKFSQAEIKTIEAALLQIYADNKMFKAWFDKNIAASGKYLNEKQNYETLRDAFFADANGINGAIDIYALGKKPIYPNIDSISFNVNRPGHSSFLAEVVETVYNEIQSTKDFFVPSMLMALRLMEVNGRFESADYEPMQTTANKKAVEYIKKINWADYPYSFILIPGAGTENYSDSISAGGIVRCRLVMPYFKNKMAPLIVVSGGRVHPYKTQYSEANEMKKYLMNIVGVPEHAIIIEPHARHTTTNIRNANRLAIAYGIPLTKKALVATTRSQSLYITNKNFDERCLKELGYIPYIINNRINPNLFEYTPLENSLIINSKEPLDP